MSTMRRKNKGPLTSERGVALLLVLWVIVFLAFVCAEFSWTMRTETASAINFKEGTQALYAAEAGINRSIIELLRVSAESRGGSRSEFSRDDRDDMDELSDEDMDGLYDEQQLWLAGGGPYRFELGDFYCEVSIIDESNKININDFLKQSAQDPTKLKSFLGEQLGLEGEELDIVADSLIDWWDEDNNVTGVFGTEDEYYESLDPPYRSRNADMQAIEECLLVRGVTEEIFYGRGRQLEARVQLIPEELEQLLSGEDLFAPLDDEEEDFDETEIIPLRLGLTDVFSVTSNASSFKININTASFEQLMLLQGMQQQSAQEIIAERTERLFDSSTDRLPQFANYEVWKDTIKVAQPHDLNNYSVYARGFSRDGRVSRSIRCSLLVSSDQCIISDWRIDG
jgi:type II secretory pathway component PulK